MSSTGTTRDTGLHSCSTGLTARWKRISLLSNPWEWVQVTPDGPLILTAVTLEEINVLCSLAIGHDCLEVGSAWGYSAVMMARQGARSVTSVDYHLPDDSNEGAENSQDVMRQAIEFFGVAGVITMICDASQAALPELISQGKRFGLVFIDGDHSYDAVLHDVRQGCRLAGDDGYIACHDYGAAGIESVTRAVDEVFPDGPDRLIGSLHIKRSGSFS